MKNFIVLSKTAGYNKVYTPLATELKTMEECERAINWQVQGGRETSDFIVVDRAKAQEMNEGGYLFNSALMPWAWKEFIERITEKKKVYLYVIEHRHGSDVDVYNTEAERDQAVYEFIIEENEKYKGMEIEKAIQEYFYPDDMDQNEYLWREEREI